MTARRPRFTVGQTITLDHATYVAHLEHWQAERARIGRLDRHQLHDELVETRRQLDATRRQEKGQAGAAARARAVAARLRDENTRLRNLLTQHEPQETL